MIPAPLLPTAADLCGRYAIDRVADRFECGGEGPVDYLKLCEALRDAPMRSPAWPSCASAPP